MKQYNSTVKKSLVKKVVINKEKKNSHKNKLIILGQFKGMSDQQLTENAANS